MPKEKAIGPKIIFPKTKQPQCSVIEKSWVWVEEKIFSHLNDPITWYKITDAGEQVGQ